MSDLPRDLSPIEWRRRRSGWFGRCPGCAHWARRIIIVAPKTYRCPRCREAVSRAPAAGGCEVRDRMARLAGMPRPMGPRKYMPLIRYLEALTEDDVRLTFAEIEAIIGASLPASAWRSTFWTSWPPRVLGGGPQRAWGGGWCGRSCTARRWRCTLRGWCRVLRIDA
jgi:hypothetical protein